jgi:flagellar protein FliO/FliZ
VKALFASVIALTLTALTATALADEHPAPAPSSTPLTTRPSRPLTLAQANEGTPLGYKVIAGVGVAAAAGLWLRKRRGNQMVKAKSRIDVLGRSSVGMRSELLVVDVEGTRLLIGMTPSSIQTLAVLETPDAVDAADATAEASEPAEEPVRQAPVRTEALERVVSIARERQAVEPAAQLGDRVRTLLANRQAAPRAAAKKAPPRRVAAPPKNDLVAGQAKGLLLSLEEPEETERPPLRLGDW